ncbi:hypothetical protein F5J12DRAFT_52487 [Pisolithus orientalis]|uniref:uncharacterized protein n=1 Tax=Pisolithus orientalis TaxID=936130 RepID=UPI0022245FC0|nr:uncharacterized protein F5J12DRAFT_52487 [Pisolithus orientalis]KAI6008779.1 hypothetical protein F5J12DRAFT_52487 [Pisolithus orientalis]
MAVARRAIARRELHWQRWKSSTLTLLIMALPPIKLTPCHFSKTALSQTHTAPTRLLWSNIYFLLGVHSIAGQPVWECRTRLGVQSACQSRTLQTFTRSIRVEPSLSHLDGCEWHQLAEDSSNPRGSTNRC